MYDIKIINNKKHIKNTGASNELILENIKYLSREASEIWIRIPIIPNFNDEVSCIEEITSFIKGLETIGVVELLPFHPIGKGKYESLNMDYVAQSLSTPTEESLHMLMDVFKRKGLEVRLG